MRLIYTADRKSARNALVAALHGMGILRIERASLLIDHNAVFFQSIVAVSVKFAGKQSLRRAKRVGGIYNNQIVSFFTTTNELQSIAKMDVHAAIIHTAGILRQIRAAGLDNRRIHFHQINVLDAVIPRQLSYNAAISGTDDQDVFCFLMNSHRHMSDHLVIDKLIAFCQHDIAVQRQNTAKFRCFKDINALIFALLRI